MGEHIQQEFVSNNRERIQMLSSNSSAVQRLRVDCVSVCVRAKSETKSQNEQLLARHELVSDAKVKS